MGIRGAYRLDAYGSMIEDEIRMDAYARALERAVRPGSVVVDLGAGTGIMALLACRLGASRVFAIEPSASIDVGREIARRNSLDTRIDFIRAMSTEVVLPRQADVVVSDLRGIVPLHTAHIPSIIDARSRFLAPNGVLIPARDVLCAGIVEAEESYRPVMAWAAHGRGFDLEEARRLVANTWWKDRSDAPTLLADAQAVATLDYAAIEDPEVKSSVTFSIHRSGTAHGICVWFDATLMDGIGFSNAPGQPETIYGRAFFPLLDAVEVEPGDEVELLLGATLTGGDYVWRWETTISGAGRTKADFRQSTALGVPLSQHLLERSSRDFHPRRDEEGEALLYVLQLMDGTLSSAEIAARLAERFPQRFSDPDESLSYVVEQAQKRSR